MDRKRTVCGAVLMGTVPPDASWTGNRTNDNHKKCWFSTDLSDAKVSDIHWITEKAELVKWLEQTKGTMAIVCYMRIICIISQIIPLFNYLENLLM